MTDLPSTTRSSQATSMRTHLCGELRSLREHRDLRVATAASEACQRILGEPLRSTIRAGAGG